MKIAKKYEFLTRLRRCCLLCLDNHSTMLGLPEKQDFARWLWQTCKNDYRRAEISILLCDEEEAREFNRDYRGKDYATNVLSFALDKADIFEEAGCLKGDLVMCAPVIAKEAAEQGKTIMQHFAHLTVHGVLHLMGCDHVNEADAQYMESLEISVMQQLGYANPYAADEC
ncbi:rRNA maturation RNase YbeY [Stenoxybacter acetivorans]|uniref:rRNA maturation RNase YbeY n=1 Tax=Stenoxybacter acetivorans TaxID=422441 RepID=UPI0005673B88|nr:rRNA maturation RNase YbeY [Stenoxybacter acetivorans]